MEEMIKFLSTNETQLANINKEKEEAGLDEFESAVNANNDRTGKDEWFNNYKRDMHYFMKKYGHKIKKDRKKMMATLTTAFMRSVTLSDVIIS